MGCTMHAHIEVKCRGTWQHYANPIVTRDYGLFALIAGVRSEDRPGITPICKHRGLPKDVSIITKACYDETRGDGLHHEGWLESDELFPLQDELYRLNPDVKRTGIDRLDLEYGIFRTYINENCIATHTGFEDSRIVFWFDN